MTTDRTWADKGLCIKNLYVVDLEAQGLGNFPEWREKLGMALEQVRWVEAAVKEVKVALGDANFLKVCLIESVGGCVVGH